MSGAICRSCRIPNTSRSTSNGYFGFMMFPGGETRGGHAYKTQHEVIMVLSGSLDIVVVDPNGNETKFCLNRSYYGLYIPPLHWRHMENFSTNSVSVHLSDSDFLEADYIRDFTEFKTLK